MPASSKKIANINPSTFHNPEPAALQAEIAARWQKLQCGINRYQNYPFQKQPCDKSVVWQSGTTRLFDCGPKDGRPLLVIPSLINRATILDLNKNHSFLRFLSQHNIRPFLIDWDAPGESENAFGIDDYMGRLIEAADFIETTTQQKPAVLGYCMGGLFAAALAALKPDHFSSLILMATPWDFFAGVTSFSLAMREKQAAMIDRVGYMPVDMIQSFFMALDPLQSVKKFLSFADLDMVKDKEKIERFVQLEDWLNDGVALTAKVARTCLVDWYGKNETAKLQWHVAGAAIDPAQIKIPTIAIIPQQDRIVPPASAAALSSAITGCLRIDPPLGHIGMMASTRAKALVWQPLIKWLSVS